MALRDGFQTRGHEAYIITPKPRDFKGVSPEHFIFVGQSMPIRAARTKGDISASVDLDKLETILRTEDFDILHFHEPWNPMLSRQILMRSDCLHIGTFHAAMSERRTSRTVERVITPYTKSILKYLDVMTAVSPTATNYVKTLTKRSQLIIPNGIDLSKYQESPRKDPKRKTRSILYIGRLEKRKGVIYLLRAFAEARIKDPNLQLIIAGDGPERNKLESLVDQEDISGVQFLGYISEEQKLRLLNDADVFCSPALYGESFGIVLLEAMATGCVTIAGNNSGYENVMSGLGQISLLNPMDSKEFARRIGLLANDENLRELWRDWAREAVRQFDYDIVIDQYLTLYETAYAKRSKKA